MRARHHRVDLLLHQAVDRRGRARDEGDAERSREQRCGGTMPGVARNIPITAVKTISDTTRGLVSATKARKRCERLALRDLGIHLEGRKPRKAKKFSTTSATSSSAAPALWRRAARAAG